MLINQLSYTIINVDDSNCNFIFFLLSQQTYKQRHELLILFHLSEGVFLRVRKKAPYHRFHLATTFNNYISLLFYLYALGLN